MAVEPSRGEQGRSLFLAAIMVLSVVAMSAAFAGSTVGADRTYTDEQALYDGSAVWHGQVIEIDGLDATEDYDLYSVADGHVTQNATDGDGTLTIDTGDHPTGVYYLEGPGTTGDADDNTFEVVEQDFSASFDDSVAPGDTVDLTLESNRASYRLEVDADGDLDQGDLATIFQNADNTDTNTGDSDSVYVDVSTDSLETDFTGIAEDTYELTLNVTDTSAIDTATVEVTEDAVVREFTQDVYDTRQAGIANMTLNLENTDTAVMQFGSFDPDAEQYYETGVTIDASDYDGNMSEVPIRMNLFAAGGGMMHNTMDDWRFPPSLFTFQPYAYTWSPTSYDNEGAIDVEVRISYLQVGDEIHSAADPNNPGPFEIEIQDTNDTYLNGAEEMLRAGAYRLVLGDEWESVEAGEEHEDLGMPLVDAEMNTVHDSATLNVQGIELPTQMNGSVVPYTADIAQNMPAEDLEDLDVTPIEDGGSVAVDYEPGEGIVEGDHLVGTLEGAGLEGAIYLIHHAAGAMRPPYIEDFGEILHWQDVGIEVRFTQENPSPLRDDVKATTNMTQHGEPTPDRETGDVPEVPDDADEWQQLELNSLLMNDYDGDLFVELNYTALDGLTTDNPATITVDFTEAARSIGIPEGVEVTLESEVVFEEADIDLEDVEELPASDNATVTAETNLAPGHEIDALAEASGWVAGATEEIAADGTALPFDLGIAQPGDTFDINATGPLGASDDLENVTIVEDEPVEPASFDVDASAPSTVAPGDDASLDVTVTNGGDEDGETNYTVTVDGETVADETISLNASDSTSSSYTIDTAETGEVSWSVETDDDSASGTVTIEEEDDDTDDDDDDEDDGDGVPGFGVAVALVALLAAAMLALRRQD